MKWKIAITVLLAGLFCACESAWCQTPSLGQYQFGAGYASVSGPTDNGAGLFFAKQMSPRAWVQAKGYMLANPAGVTIASVGPRYRIPLSAVWKKSEYFDTTRWIPFVDGNIGVVKDPAGVAKFAYGVGAGLDYQANPTLTLLIVQADYYRSKFFPSGGILVSNVRAITSGLKISF